MENMCRTCLCEVSVSSKAIFKSILQDDDDSDSPLISELIRMFSSTEVKENDDLPKLICSDCIFLLNSAYKFKINAEKAYIYLCSNLDSKENIKEENIKEETVLDNNSDCGNEQIADETPIKECKESIFDNKNDIGKFNGKTITAIQNEKKKSKRRIQEKKHFCTMCPKKFRYPSQLDHHIFNHDGKNYYCQICKKYYRDKKVHVKNVHVQMRYQCDICSKSFVFKSKLCKHIQSHSNLEDRKLYSCSESGCQMKYSSKHGLLRHKQVHTGQKNFLCESCSKTFTDKYLLKNHCLIMHSLEKMFKCRFCGLAFKTNGGKNYHQKAVHSGERKYICTVCKKSFLTNSKLKRHLLSHSEAKDHKCTYCSKLFRTKDQKTRHERTMHGVCNKNEDDTSVLPF